MLLLLPDGWSALRRRPRLAVAVTALILGAAFAVVYGQAALYSGNQPTYLLKPYADAGHGFLTHDWLANTADRMPATSFLVRLTLEHLGEGALQLYQAVLIGTYWFALAGLGAFAMRTPTRGRLWLYLAVIFALHLEGGWNLLTSGFAGQSPTLQVFEPALFGTLLVLSLYLFARRRHLLSVACLAVAAVSHPTYLLPAGVIAATYGAVVLARDRRARLAAGMVGLYGLLVAPIAIYTLTTFRPESPSVHARASGILADLRIPYHTDPAVWFRAEDVVRIALILVAIFLVRRTRLAPVLLVLFVVGAVLTLARVALDSRDLGLLFPWRVSVVLVPAATAIVMARAVEWAMTVGSGALARRERLVAGFGAAALAVITAVRVPALVEAAGARASDAEPISGWAASHKRPGDVYLLPVGGRLAQIDEWGRFRLRTGAPIYVDLKSHPLRDGEVVEWWSRVQTARGLYRFGFPPCQGLRSLQRTDGVNAVVVSTAAPAPAGCPDLRVVYRDPQWSLYRLASPAPPLAARPGPPAE